MFSDLECDFVNPIDLCAKLNPVGYTKYLITTLFLVCSTRVWFTLVLDTVNAFEFPMVRIVAQFAIGLVSCSPGQGITALVRSHRNIPSTSRTQAGKLCKIDILSHLFLLLPLPNDSIIY